MFLAADAFMAGRGKQNRPRSGPDALDGEGWLLISVPTPPALPDPAHVREGYKPAHLCGMLEERGFDVLEIQFCMYRFLRWLLANWEKLPYRPRVLIRGLSYLDRLFSLGP